MDDYDWRDFKARNGGIVGARSGFETACETLIRRLNPHTTVQAVRASPGDEGIDICVGDLGQEPITVYQCKFFLETLGPSQKEQIRRSFHRAIASGRWITKKWVLCLPKTLDIDELTWWSTFKSTAASSGVAIELLNGEQLLVEAKTHKLLETWFKIQTHAPLASEVEDLKKRVSELSLALFLATHSKDSKDGAYQTLDEIGRALQAAEADLKAEELRAEISRLFGDFFGARSLHELDVCLATVQGLLVRYPDNADLRLLAIRISDAIETEVAKLAAAPVSDSGSRHLHSRLIQKLRRMPLTWTIVLMFVSIPLAAAGGYGLYRVIVYVLDLIYIPELPNTPPSPRLIPPSPTLPPGIGPSLPREIPPSVPVLIVYWRYDLAAWLSIVSLLLTVVDLSLFMFSQKFTRLLMRLRLYHRRYFLAMVFSALPLIHAAGFAGVLIRTRKQNFGYEWYDTAWTVIGAFFMITVSALLFIEMLLAFGITLVAAWRFLRFGKIETGLGAMLLLVPAGFVMGVAIKHVLASEHWLAIVGALTPLSFMMGVCIYLFWWKDRTAYAVGAARPRHDPGSEDL